MLDGWQIIFWNNDHGGTSVANMVVTVGFSDGSSIVVPAPDTAPVLAATGSRYSAQPNIVVSGSL